MNDLTQSRYDLAAELGSAGVMATVDPGAVLGLVTQHGVCALIQKPRSYAPLTYGLDFDMVIPVWLITSAPDDADALERLEDALVLVWPVTRPVEFTEHTLYEGADQTMPALVIPTGRHVTCQP